MTLKKLWLLAGSHSYDQSNFSCESPELNEDQNYNNQRLSFKLFIKYYRGQLHFMHNLDDYINIFLCIFLFFSPNWHVKTNRYTMFKCIGMKWFVLYVQNIKCQMTKLFFLWIILLLSLAASKHKTYTIEVNH